MGVKMDRYTKVILTVIAVLLVLILLKERVGMEPVFAQSGVNGIGRYQIALRDKDDPNIYWIVDTTTGQVKRKHHYWVRPDVKLDEGDRRF